MYNVYNCKINAYNLTPLKNIIIILEHTVLNNI